MTDFWRRRRGPNNDSTHATHQFERWHGHTGRSIDILAKAPAMNDLGRRFVSGMASTLQEWQRRPFVDLRPAVSAPLGRAEPSP